MSEEINTDHFSTMEELLEHLKMWERDDDIDSYYRFFCPSCAFELANKIEKQQKEIKELKEKIVDLETKLAIETIDNKYNQEERDEETIPRYKIREKLEGLEEQKEKLKYDGDRCFADYEQFCKNLNFFKEQIDKILEEN